jgi:hypothetical protein
VLGMPFVRHCVGKLCRAVGLGLWCLLGLWTAPAAFFTAPLSVWPAALRALGAAGLYAGALPERWLVRGRPGRSGRDIRRSAAALAVTAAVAVWYFAFVTPSPDEDWIPQHDRMPAVTVGGDKVHVRNVRNFTWRTGSTLRRGTTTGPTT